MKVYISGKIEDEVMSDATRQMFSKAENTLTSKGYEVFNPASDWLRVRASILEGIRYRDCRKRSFDECRLALGINELSFCNAIYMIGSFMGSPSAIAEYYFALATGKQFFFNEEAAARWHIRRLYNKAPGGVFWYDWVDRQTNEMWVPFSD